MKNRVTSELFQMAILFIGSIVVVTVISKIWQRISMGLAAFPG